MDPRRRLTLVSLLSHDWLCGRVDVPATPLMTPDVLDMSGSHVGTALRVALNAYHKAARTGFTLMDVSNAPLAKRRKKKNFSSESQKGSDDSTETSDNKADTRNVSQKNDTGTPDSGDSDKKLLNCNSAQGSIPALAVCLSPSSSNQRVIDTVATSREPPPLRPISSDYELSSTSSNSTDSNFFFKEFQDVVSAQEYSHYSFNRLSSKSSSNHSHYQYTNHPAARNRNEYDCIDNNPRQTVVEYTSSAQVDTKEGLAPPQGPDSKVLVQRTHGMSQYTCSAPFATTKQSRKAESDVVNNNNILDIALSGLREGNRSRKRPYQP